VTDGFEQWVIGLPVWFQTPLVLAALSVVALAAAVVLLRVLALVLPPDEAERRAFGGVSRGSGGSGAGPGDRDREGGARR
jgi:hypothetical protein